MKRLLIITGFCCCVVACALAAEKPRERPNIVFILTDDQRWDEMSSLYMPNVQNDLIDRGIEFQNGFVSNPLCCPARATIPDGPSEAARPEGVEQ